MKFSFLGQLGASVLITAWLIWGSIMLADMLVEPDESAADAFRTPTETAVAEAKPVAEAQPAAAPVAPAPVPGAAEGGLTALLAAASADAGEKVFKKCKACHTTGKGGKNKVGPNLWSIVGRAKATGEKFKFSSALKGLGGEWSYADLDGFLMAPKEFAPGNKMPFKGLKDAGDRAALITYLRSLSDSPKPLP
jgi:cytochrome c